MYMSYVTHCTVYTIHCTVYTIHCTVYTIHCTVYTVQRIRYKGYKDYIMPSYSNGYVILKSTYYFFYNNL